MRSPQEDLAWSVRVARNPDCPGLPDIERSAAQIFVDFGMPDVASGEITAAEAWEPHCANETIWVAVDSDDRPIAFLASGIQPPVLFIYELAVRREWQRRGIGRALLAKAADYAKGKGLYGVGLTTFCDVPWNGPYYAGQGYDLVQDEDLPPSMQPVIAAERTRWPEPDRRRCAMVKAIGRG